jgi:hypothetical protein
LSGGHYTAHAYNPFTQKWHNFNDSSVSECKSNGDYIFKSQLPKEEFTSDSDNSISSPASSPLESYSPVPLLPPSFTPLPNSYPPSPTPAAYLLFYCRRGFYLIFQLIY